MKRTTGPRSAALLVLTILSLVTSAHLPVQATCEEIDPLLVLPNDGVCQGWIRDGEPVKATTIEELAEIIDGAAYLYGQYGFVAAAFQNYSGEVAGEPTLMTLAAFNQGTAENAEALYNDSDSGSGDPVGDWNGTGQARMRIAFGTVTFQFWETCFFVSIIVVTGGEEAVPAARCIADAVVNLIQNPTAADQRTWGGLRILFR